MASSNSAGEREAQSAAARCPHGREPSSVHPALREFDDRCRSAWSSVPPPRRTSVQWTGRCRPPAQGRRPVLADRRAPQTRLMRCSRRPPIGTRQPVENSDSREPPGAADSLGGHPPVASHSLHGLGRDAQESRHVVSGQDFLGFGLPGHAATSCPQRLGNAQ